MVSSHSKSTGIPRVDGLSTGPPDLGCHTLTHCPLHETEDGSFPQLKAFEFGLVFGVKFEGNLMLGALNQLVGSHQWIPATRTLI